MRELLERRRWKHPDMAHLVGAYLRHLDGETHDRLAAPLVRELANAHDFDPFDVAYVLTWIGNEVTQREPNDMLRSIAREGLVHRILPACTFRVREELESVFDLSTLINFFAEDPRHGLDIRERDEKAVVQFLRIVDDRLPRGSQSERTRLATAAVHLGATEFLRLHGQAIPTLYRYCAESIHHGERMASPFTQRAFDALEEYVAHSTVPSSELLAHILWVCGRCISMEEPISTNAMVLLEHLARAAATAPA